MAPNNIVDTIIVCLFLGLCFFLGILQKKKVGSLKSFLRFKDISVATLLCTLIASSIGAGGTFGRAEKIYLFGLAFAVTRLLTPLYWLISAYLIAPCIERFKGCFTVSEIMYSSHTSRMLQYKDFGI